MANQLPFIFRAAPLPSNFRGTPQQLLDAMVARLSAESETEIAVFVTGAVEPSSNVGPWLKDGTTWYVWSDIDGAYVPQTIPATSLGYFVGSDTPDPLLYTFWIQTAVGGSPLALKTYYSGAWVDVYATTLAGYLTTVAAAATYQTIAAMADYLTTAAAAATYQTIADMANYLTIASASATYKSIASFNSDIANYSTTTAMNAAIAAAASSYPAQATVTTQSIPTTGADTKVTLNATNFNPSPAPFNTSTNRYTAPANGYYNVSVVAEFSNNTGDAATMECEVILYKNGSDAGINDLDGTPSPNGARWSPGFSALIALNAGDYIELYANANDTPGSGAVNLTVRAFSVNRASA